MPALPLKPLNTFIKHHYPGDISLETTITLRDILLEFTTLLIQQTVQEFTAMNKRRQIQGLPALKRLDKASLITVWQNILNRITNKNIIGEVGNHNTILLHRDGVNNETKT